MSLPVIRRGDVIGMLLLFGLGSAAAKSDVLVNVVEGSSPAEVVCRYTITNRAPKPIDRFSIGGGSRSSEPYEISQVPLSWEIQPGRTVNVEPAPPGWEAALLSDPKSGRYAFEWHAENFTDVILPGDIFDLFQLTLAPGPGVTCRGLRWTAITRDMRTYTGRL